MMDAAIAAGEPVALKEIGVSPPEEAVSVLTPAAVPSFHPPTVAMPDAFVVWVAPTMLPPPDVTENVTLAPATGFPSASVTSTEGAVERMVLTIVVWLLPIFTRRFTGPPARPSALKVT